MNYIYHGNSMKRVFQAGDVPELREIPFHEFRRGDIVCFRRPDGAEVIHRVYHTAPEALTTWGDNNLRPDPEPVRAEWNPRLAVGFRRGGNRYALPRGHAGMRQFRFNRLRFHLRRLCGIPFRFLARGARWWGIRQLEYETFARDRHYFYRLPGSAKTAPSNIAAGITGCFSSFRKTIPSHAEETVIFSAPALAKSTLWIMLSNSSAYCGVEQW